MMRLFPIQLIFLCVIGLLSSCEPKVNRRYYPTGQLQYVDSLDRSGHVRSITLFRRDGTLESTSPLKNDSVHGIVKWYDEKGQLESTEVWDNGKKNGLVNEFYPNGVRKCLKVMRGNITVDTSNFYYPTGQFVRFPESSASCE
ncbi:toxin-antitoxin system YwqK family antitoxin [Hymenobacter canadensis]|uniref:Toxin-antitoxin system YwqK family antitoxin n=1 Tax=Hymenobacter canadensis TaxID=2999067 RepID=A0ABY7LWY7_9BACT|nr:hypothetical protein [Hymenobacter canadensis]WBA44384.1 hypothetical protein O3303_21775 [Hymenobacter canadensis]